MIFATDACNQLVVRQLLNIISLSSVNTDFSLSLPAGITGVTLSATSGTTPAQVMVTVYQAPNAPEGSALNLQVLRLSDTAVPGPSRHVPGAAAGPRPAGPAAAL